MLAKIVFKLSYTKKMLYCLVNRQMCPCVCANRKQLGTSCTPTKARHSFQAGLKADFLQTKVAAPEQATPEEHPVQAGTVVHNDHASLPRNEAIACDHHLHAEYQLQQGLGGGHREERWSDKFKGRATRL